MYYYIHEHITELSLYFHLVKINKLVILLQNPQAFTDQSTTMP